MKLILELDTTRFGNKGQTFGRILMDLGLALMQSENEYTEPTVICELREDETQQIHGRMEMVDGDVDRETHMKEVGSICTLGTGGTDIRNATTKDQNERRRPS